MIDAAEFLGRVGAGDRMQLDQAGRQPQGFGDGQVARLVETDVPVAADAEQLDVQPAVGLDPAVKLRRVRGRERLGHRAVEHVRAVRRDVDVAEQMAVHVRPVALGIERADRVVLVEVVGRHVPK